MKNITAIILALMIFLSASVTVFADDENVRITTDDGLQSDSQITAEGPALRPFDIEYTSLNGTSIIIKRYELPAESNTGGMPESFSQHGTEYRLIEMLEKKQPPVVESKTVSEPVTAMCQSNQEADMIAALAPYMDYDQNGFSGQLMLDRSSLTASVAGISHYSYQTSTTREFAGLDRADTAYIPKTIQDGSRALQLADIDWTSYGAAHGGNNLYPSAFTATATYTGTASGSKATGYTISAFYTGEVSRTEPGTAIYSAIYQAETSNTPDLTMVWVTFFGIITIGAAIYFMYTYITKRAIDKIRRRRTW